MDEPHPAPFDDYAGANKEEESGERRIHLKPLYVALRLASALAFILAIASACMVLALDGLHLLDSDLLPWRLKSAFPLIFVGISYGCLQFTLPRSPKELVLGMCVCIGFILWGSEQFIPNPALASLIDDVVMFLFVLDLSIVIRGYLKQKKS